MTTPPTTDYTQSQLDTLLTGILDSSDLVKLLDHFPNGAVVETDTGPGGNITQAQDASGNNPNLLLLQYSNDTVDLSQFPNVHNIVQEYNSYEDPPLLTVLTINSTLNAGDDHANLYLQATSSTGQPNDTINELYQVTDNINKLHVFGSNANIVLESNSTQTVIAKDGGNLINADTGTLTVKLGGDNNVVNIGPNPGSVTAKITGLSSTDLVTFDLPQSDYSITQTTDAAGNKITEVVGSAGGGFSASVTMNGWHDAVTFSGGPVHYV